ncbi:MAG: DUF4410 domain-containing protein [Candidatus Binatia bacterium]
MKNRQVLVGKGVSYVVALLLILSAGGCAQTVVQPKYEQRTAGPVGHPRKVLVYDFALTGTEVRENQGLFATVGNALHDTTKNDRELAIAQKVQTRMVEDLITGIRNLGLPAQRAEQGAALPTDAVAITGFFLKIDEGDRLQRTVLGFGAGQSTVDAKVSVFAPSAMSGRTKLLEFSTHADSGAAPGALVTGGVGAAASGGMTVGIAAANVGVGAAKGYHSQVEQMTARSAGQAVAYLSQYFAKQGWISQEKVTYAKISE